MPRPTGPPVIIPEEGLHVPPAIWQVVFILAAPFIAATAIALPLLLIVWAVSSLGLFILNQISPPESDLPPLYPPQTDDHEST